MSIAARGGPSRCQMAITIRPRNLCVTLVVWWGDGRGWRVRWGGWGPLARISTSNSFNNKEGATYRDSFSSFLLSFLFPSPFPSFLSFFLLPEKLPVHTGQLAVDPKDIGSGWKMVKDREADRLCNSLSTHVALCHGHAQSAQCKRGKGSGRAMVKAFARPHCMMPERESNRLGVAYYIIH